MKHRLFIAVKIPDEIQNKIIKSISIPKNFKIIKPENLHVTILFLGDTDEETIPQINKTLQEISNKFESFNLEISGFGQFPSNGYPRIIYITGDKGKQELSLLAEEIRNKMKPLGYIDDKNFEYHVTVARMKFKSPEKAILPPLDTKYNFKTDKIILFKSELKPEGPIYIPLWIGNLKNS